MKIILVPTDFSPCSIQALKTAIALAQITGAKIVIQHNVYTETSWEDLPSARRVDYPETLAKVKEAEDNMSVLLRNSPFGKVTISSKITYGTSNEEILSEANKLKADLIVMGSHGNEEMDRYFIGSTVQKVMRDAKCPVMTVQKNYRPSKWKKMVFATDFSKEIYKPFEKIRKLIGDLKATVYLVFVNGPTGFMDTRAINSMMDSFVVRYPEIKFQKVIYNHDDPAEGILQFAEDNPVDMIALVTHRRAAKPKYLVGQTETLAFRSNVPVLSMNILPVPLK